MCFHRSFKWIFVLQIPHFLSRQSQTRHIFKHCCSAVLLCFVIPTHSHCYWDWDILYFLKNIGDHHCVNFLDSDTWTQLCGCSVILLKILSHQSSPLFQCQCLLSKTYLLQLFVRVLLFAISNLPFGHTTRPGENLSDTPDNLFWRRLMSSVVDAKLNSWCLSGREEDRD